ncbi:MAG: elongation factor P [Planctomycetes bacterium]|nr:elongation factor P [Planctomycetota bacterium]
MSLTDELHKGMVIRHEGQLFTVLYYSVAQTGKQKPTVHVKLRSLSTGNTGERTLDQLGTLDEVPSEVREMQYLYSSGRQQVFMDVESYEQYELGEEVLGNSSDFMVEEQTYRFLTIDGQPVSAQLPAHAVLTVVDTAPPAHAGGGSSVLKEAQLTGALTVYVPLFIKTGDRIRINTETREYLGKEHA